LAWIRADLEKLNDGLLRNESATGSIFVQRVARLYERTEHGGINIPTVFLVKPDQKRYWLKSRALDDAAPKATIARHGQFLHQHGLFMHHADQI
jgi:hypothetical protein